MKVKLAIVAAFVLAVAVIIGITLMNKGDNASKDPALAGSGSGSGSAGGAVLPTPASVTEISMLYGSEKKDWVEAAAALFAKEHPEIKVKLVVKGSLDAEQAIVDDKEKPTVFSPADSLILALLDSDWTTKNKTDLFAKTGDDVPQTLVITPLVFVAWEDRANALVKAGGGNITWKSLRKAIVSNQGWPAVGGKSEWGFVKLGHTDPTRSNSGLQALVLMSLEFYGKPTLEIGDLLKPDYQTFVKEVEKGVSKFETSTGTFMTDMVRFGPSKYDVSVVYESLAISQVENAQGRWGNLKVYYPQTTLWSDHPIAILQGDWVTPAQRAAARTWIAYLRSKPVQESALAFGFRPADPTVPIKTGDPSNPFTKLAQYGVKIDIPPVAKNPEGAVVRNLLTMWSRVAAPK
jgi:ABC-type Fe3+ transport system substrate-binding protein